MIQSSVVGAYDGTAGSVTVGATGRNTFEVRRACGHVESVYMRRDVRKAGGNQRKQAAKDVRAEEVAAWYVAQEAKSCKVCWLDGEHAMDAKFDLEHFLLPLEGSEKQEAWARSIRRKFLTRCLTSDGFPMPEFVQIAAMTRATFWINVRNVDVSEVVARVAKLTERMDDGRPAGNVYADSEAIMAA